MTSGHARLQFRDWEKRSSRLLTGNAQELLTEGRALLVRFGDANAIGYEIAGLLKRRCAAKRNAGAGLLEQSLNDWERTAERYLDVFEKARRRTPA